MKWREQGLQIVICAWIDPTSPPAKTHECLRLGFETQAIDAIRCSHVKLILVSPAPSSDCKDGCNFLAHIRDLNLDKGLV